MPSKLDFYAQMADHTAKQVTGSFGEWTAFLETAGRLYKYPFHEQLMIYAQKPDATACADYDLWYTLRQLQCGNGKCDSKCDIRRLFHRVSHPACPAALCPLLSGKDHGKYLLLY